MIDRVDVKPFIEYAKKVLVRSVLAGLAVTAMSGCFGGSSDGESATSTTVAAEGAIAATPNYLYLRDGKTCEAGDPRPCHARLRSAPNRSTDENIMNVFQRGETRYFKWPQEAYKDEKGDKVEIVCQVLGDETTNVRKESSKVWGVVKTPVDYVNLTNDEIEQGANKEFGVVRDEGEITHVYLFTPDIWLGNKIRPELGKCTKQENPQGFPSALNQP